MSEEPSDAKRLRPWALFLLFTQLSLLGFGGVLPIAYRLLVERRQMLRPDEFASLLGLAQLLPGATICNLSVIIGYRHAGVRGALAALAGMVAVPMFVVILVGAAYGLTRDSLIVQRLLAGMSAVAVGLIIAIALKIGGEFRKNWLDLVLAGLALLSIAWLRLPLLPVIAVLLPLSFLLHWRRQNGQR